MKTTKKKNKETEYKDKAQDEHSVPHTAHTHTHAHIYKSLSPKWDTRKANCEEFYLQNGSDKTARIHKSSHNFFARCERVERLNGRINKQASMQSKVQRQCHRMQCNNTNSLYEHRIMSLLHFCITLIGTIPERALPPSISLSSSSPPLLTVDECREWFFSVFVFRCRAFMHFFKFDWNVLFPCTCYISFIWKLFLFRCFSGYHCGKGDNFPHSIALHKLSRVGSSLWWCELRNCNEQINKICNLFD